MKKCAICGKNTGFLTITRFEKEGVPKTDVICIDCAKKMGLSPMDEMMKQVNLSENEMKDISDQLMRYLGNTDPAEFENNPLFNMMSPEENDALISNELQDENEAYEGDYGEVDYMGDNSDENFNLTGGNKGVSYGVKADTRAPRKKFKVLDKYGDNLNQMAISGKIDRVVGRDREIERVVQILARRRKNNPCLIGEPGVGKTAISQGLAVRIVEGNVPSRLKNMTVFQLDLTAIVAGTQFRGQFESRMKAIIDDARNAGNVILVIDEIHNIVGAGEVVGGVMNAGNILKPALANGSIQLIGATTLDEYRKHMEKDKALERRFQKVVIEEPSIEDSIEILKGIKPYYEEHHSIKISDEICELAVKLADRYINDRFLPDKAIDLIDEAGAMLNLKNVNYNRLKEYNDELMDIISQKESASLSDNFEMAAKYKQRELKLRQDIEEIQTEFDDFRIEERDIRKVLESWTGIPVSELSLEDRDKILNLEANIKKRIIGQDEAVISLTKAVRRARSGFKKRKKPDSFIFVGPTGVGKTELAKSLAKELFGDEKAIIRLDMSEYMEKHNVSKLIGAPPGYVGFDSATQLTDEVRKKPHSIILLDEIEKAHPDVFNILLQILDDGRLTDSLGRTVHFEHSIIIMTSNSGTSHKGSSLGFNSSEKFEARKKMEESLKDVFKAEFLGRVDEIIVFKKLEIEDIRRIVEAELASIARDVSEKGIALSLSDAAKDFLARSGYSEKYGARVLKKKIQSSVEDEIADLFLNGKLDGKDKIFVDFVDDKLEFNIA